MNLMFTHPSRPISRSQLFLTSAMVAIVASPSPGSVTASARARNHLTYKNMILSAIEALKDPGGSSLNAISNFILRTIRTYLHLTLVSLLTTFAALAPTKRRGRPPKLRGVAEVTLKRRSGRRPKTSDRPAAAVDSTPVYVLQQDEQLKSALLQIFRRATSIVLPEASSDVTLKTEEPKSPESAQAKQATAGVEEQQEESWASSKRSIAGRLSSLPSASGYVSDDFNVKDSSAYDFMDHKVILKAQRKQ
ncbi:hypothetical protein HPP92_003150 [Vanilla planifolia]|uniref:H15 domain-containing protein n=1 Tax=Vanilla planifolia TaxID=51239 RepID=A0A835VN60_VANPL|nr:hypothetical protein HPP92_003150 [Vanilla planifolia]